MKRGKITDKFEMGGIDLGAIGIGDVIPVVDMYGAEIALAEHFVRQILGSITFGPIVFDLNDKPLGGLDEEDFDWPLAE